MSSLTHDDLTPAGKRLARLPQPARFIAAEAVLWWAVVADAVGYGLEVYRHDAATWRALYRKRLR